MTHEEFVQRIFIALFVVTTVSAVCAAFGFTLYNAYFG